MTEIRRLINLLRDAQIECRSQKEINKYANELAKLIYDEKDGISFEEFREHLGYHKEWEEKEDVKIKSKKSRNGSKSR
nr:hypothetical protein [Clostridia bacterium]